MIEQLNIVKSDEFSIKIIKVNVIIIIIKNNAEESATAANHFSAFPF
jgi:hypothetical protein